MDQFIDRVNHVVWMSSLERFDENVRSLERTCNTQLAGPFDRADLGVRIAISFSAGVEVLAPLDASTSFGKILHEQLATRGEGVFAVVIGVNNIETALSRARELGYSDEHIYEPRGGEPWEKHTVVNKEVALGSLMNTRFGLCEIVYPEGIIKKPQQR